MKSDSLQDRLALALPAVLEAGRAIMRIYRDGFSVTLKDDQSPLTEADRASHEILVAALQDSGPVLSEESAARPYPERAVWPAFWSVDPLDGTKEFVKRNHEFTVNVAWVEAGQPVLGIVWAPALRELYIGVRGAGAFRATDVEDVQSLERACAGFPTLGKPFERLPSRPHSSDPLGVVASRSHLNEETKSFIAVLERSGQRLALASRGSALKLCMVASGEASLYPRLAPTMEWDTAAAQAVLECAGGRVVIADAALLSAWQEHGTPALNRGTPLGYGREELTNPPFLAYHGSLVR